MHLAVQVTVGQAEERRVQREIRAPLRRSAVAASAWTRQAYLVPAVTQVACSEPLLSAYRSPR